MKRAVTIASLILAFTAGATFAPASSTPVVAPATFSNLDVNPDHREVREFFRRWQAIERLERLLPARFEAILDAATTQTVLTEINRGATSGSVSLPSIAGALSFTLTSSAWVAAAQGDFSINVQVDRSLDAGNTWQPIIGYTAATLGPSCVVGPIPGTTKTETCTPRTRFTFDGLAGVWRWTITPNTPFVWGISATF